MRAPSGWDGKANVLFFDANIFWLKDKSLEDSDDLPDPDVLGQEIVDDLQTARTPVTHVPAYSP